MPQKDSFPLHSSRYVPALDQGQSQLDTISSMAAFMSDRNRKSWFCSYTFHYLNEHCGLYLAFLTSWMNTFVGRGIQASLQRTTILFIFMQPTTCLHKCLGRVNLSEGEHSNLNSHLKIPFFCQICIGLWECLCWAIWEMQQMHEHFSAHVMTPMLLFGNTFLIVGVKCDTHIWKLFKLAIRRLIFRDSQPANSLKTCLSL